MTIFHVIALTAFIAALPFGYMVGERYFGVVGGVIGAILAGYVGLVVGRLPGFLSTRWLLNSLERKSSDELREMIRNKRFYIYHLAFAQLMARGEDIQLERRYVIDLLSSDVRDHRFFGWHTLRLAFPELADQIPDYEPGGSLEECRDMVQRLELT